jgi:deoxyribodipyrimidine photo-lyase
VGHPSRVIPRKAKSLHRGFPESLNGEKVLLATRNAVLRRSLDQWFDDHDVQPTVAAELQDSALTKTFGQAARQTLRDFLNRRLSKYETSGNQPEQQVTSGLSPRGHISAPQIFHETISQDDWTSAKIAGKATSSSTGWWGASADVEAFLDQLVTWRELGYNMC